MKNKIRLISFPAVFFIAGCTVGPDYTAPQLPLPDTFSAGVMNVAASSAAPAPDDIELWWRRLSDEELNSLVERAVKQNPDLEMALARLQQARSIESAMFGGALPSLEASAGAGRGSGTNSVRGRVAPALHAGDNSTGLKEITQIAGFDAQWELDFFGKSRREIEAAEADAQAAAELRNAALVSLVSDVARAYADFRAAQLRLAIARDNVQSERQISDLVQARFKRGMTNELDTALATRQFASVEAEIAPLTAALEGSKRRVAVLLGEFPQALDTELSKAAPLPAPPDSITAGLPVDLLRRRPDIRAAERELAAATARIGVATADLFPRVSLTAAAGFQGQGLGRVPADSSSIWSAGPAAYWPLLDFGTLDAVIHAREFRERELAANYKKMVLGAVEEANNAIDNFSAQSDRVKNIRIALDASKRATALATQRYDRGLTDFLNVLDARRQMYALQDQYVAAQQAALVQFIAVYKGLGGGWQTFQDVPDIPRAKPALIAVFKS